MKAIELSTLMVGTYRPVYEAAASLFDSNTTLDLENEYARGVTETVMRIVGIDSDYKDEIAEVISIFTMDVDTKAIARQWIEANGQAYHEGMEDRLRNESDIPISDDEMAIILDLIENAQVSVQFS